MRRQQSLNSHLTCLGNQGDSILPSTLPACLSSVNGCRCRCDFGSQFLLLSISLRSSPTTEFCLTTCPLKLIYWRTKGEALSISLFIHSVTHLYKLGYKPELKASICIVLGQTKTWRERSKVDLGDYTIAITFKNGCSHLFLIVLMSGSSIAAE